MHRFVDSKDVIDYSTGARKRDIQLTKDEDIEYRDGILQHSSGDTSVKVKNSRDIEEQNDELNKQFSDVFSAHGSYSLDLERCQARTTARQKRTSYDNIDQAEMTEESLMGHFDMGMVVVLYDSAIVNFTLLIIYLPMHSTQC